MAGPLIYLFFKLGYIEKHLISTLRAFLDFNDFLVSGHSIDFNGCMMPCKTHYEIFVSKLSDFHCVKIVAKANMLYAIGQLGK